MRGRVFMGVAFVDTLTCGMGALVLIWMALAATPPQEPGVPGRGAQIMLTVRDEPDLPAAPKPLLAVRIRIDGKLLTPKQASSGGNQVDPPLDGSPGYIITLSDSDADTELIVIVHDLAGRPSAWPVQVFVESLSGKGKAQETITLPLDSPVLMTKLKGAADGKQLEWKGVGIP